MNAKALASKLQASPASDLPIVALVPVLRRRARRAGRWLRGVIEQRPVGTPARDVIRELGRDASRANRDPDAALVAERILRAIDALSEEDLALSAVSRLPEVLLSPPPSLEEGRAVFRAWAKAVGVEDTLRASCAPLLKISGPVSVVKSSLRQAGLEDGTIEDALFAFVEGRGRATGILAYLQHLAQEVVVEAVEKREADALVAVDPSPEDAAPPDDPLLAGVFPRLLELRRKLLERHAPRPFAPHAGGGHIMLLEDPPRVGYLEGLTRVELDLSRWRQGPLSFSERAMGLPVAVTAVEELIDVVLEPQPGEREALRALAGAPPWERLLDGMERLATLAAAETAEEQGPEGYVSWRVQPHHVTAVAYVHKPLKKGGFSSGSRTSLTRLLDDPPRGMLPQDETFARALIETEARRFSSYVPPEERIEVLALLVGHPRVYLEGDKHHPVEVRRAPLRLRVVEAEGGFTLEAYVDEMPLPPEDRGLVRSGATILVDEERHRLLLVRVDAKAAALLELLRQTGAVVPDEQRESLMKVLHRIERVVPVALPPSLEGEPVEADPTLVVRLTPREGGALTVELGVRPLVGGRFMPPGEGSEGVTGLVEGRRVTARRDLPAERARAARLVERLPLDEPDDETRPIYTLARLEDGLALLAALTELSEARAKAADGAADEIPAFVLEWPEGARPLSLTRAATAKDLRVRIERGRDWLDLEGGLEIDGEELELARLLDAARRGERYVKLSEDKWVPLGERLLKDLARVAQAARTSRGKNEVGPQATLALDELAEEGADVDGDETWARLRERFGEAMRGRPKLPRGLQAELRPYQREGFEWLWRLSRWGVGGVLADDMGLGKTVQTIAMLVERQEEGPQLVVAPTSVCFNWQRECERFAPGLRPRLFAGTGREGMLDALGPRDVLIVSYGVLARDAEVLGKVRFATGVFDEAQAMKNASTQRAKAARVLDVEWRVALTGTPLENHLGELWSIFRVASPGLLGSWEQFRRDFAGPIEKDGSASHRRALARLVRPFLLRRTKREVADDLPPRTEILHLVELSGEERTLYDQARLAVLAALEEEGGDARFKMLAGITRLRLAACHPAFEEPDTQLSSSKLEAVLELLSEVKEGEHRALVFSQFTKHLALVRAALEEQGFSYLYLDGSTPQDERARLVDAFQSGAYDVFLISLKAGGTGLNLTAADYVLHLDPWWNPAVEDQATDRAHRLGQERPVTVYRLVSRGTIEEKIVKLHAEKRELVDSVLEGTGAAASLSVEELRALVAGE